MRWRGHRRDWQSERRGKGCCDVYMMMMMTIMMRRRKGEHQRVHGCVYVCVRTCAPYGPHACAYACTNMHTQLHSCDVLRDPDRMRRRLILPCIPALAHMSPHMRAHAAACLCCLCPCLLPCPACVLVLLPLPLHSLLGANFCWPRYGVMVLHGVVLPHTLRCVSSGARACPALLRFCARTLNSSDKEPLPAAAGGRTVRRVFLSLLS